MEMNVTKKRLKPNLHDPMMSKRIVKALKEPEEDYWEPLKVGYNNLVNKIIKPNAIIIIIIVIVVLFLLYRFRISRKKNRMRKNNHNDNVSDRIEKRTNLTDREYAELINLLHVYELDRTTEPTMKSLDKLDTISRSKIDRISVI